MKGKTLISSFLILIASAFFVTSLSRTEARPAGGAVASPVIGPSDIGGVVTSAKGPEAGVWVIAETTDLPTKFVKIVVTDDQGRYVIPELPKANYKVWVRGYGLVDSKPVQTSSGKTTNLTAVLAPSPLAAAQYYPAEYWYSLIQVPPESAFPIKGGARNQAEWIDEMKLGSILTHQMGDKATREFPETLGKFKSSKDAWEAWMNSAESPVGRMGKSERDLELSMYADWSDRIAAGEYPKQAPPRPQGVERNVVISEWDWSDPKGFIHDEITTDKRNPSVNANGPIYSIEQFSKDVINVVDPLTSTFNRVFVPTRDENMPLQQPGLKKLTWGNEPVSEAKANLHNPMMDQKGRLWLTGSIREAKNQPSYCKAGSDLPSVKLFPLDSSPRQLILFDPKIKQFKFIDTCFGTHHLEFAEDANNTLWMSTLSSEVAWFNTKLYDETGDAVKAQGWCPLVVDTNGNGKRDAWTEPDEAMDPTRDWRVYGHSYGIAINPVDGSIWLANQYGTPRKGSQAPGSIMRVVPGSNPPMTCLTEYYEPPFYNSKVSVTATAPKGIDIDRNGRVWVALSSSGHFAEFDRSKCKVLNGPTATGQHCPEGWTIFPTPGPNFKGASHTGSADYHYLDWVDQYDALGLGKNIPITDGTNSDSLVALMPDSGGKFVILRVPYPMGYYSRGMDGRIDDPKAGWKGKGLWSSYASTTPWAYEGGKGAQSKAVKFQVRPDPLAH